MKKIAVIGTGIMGHGMAANFLKHGFEVIVWNRDKKKLKLLVQKGAVVAVTPREAAAKADTVFEVTANDESSRSVWFYALRKRGQVHQSKKPRKYRSRSS